MPTIRSRVLAGLAAVVVLAAGCGGSPEPGAAHDSSIEGKVIPAGATTDGLVVTLASQPDPLASGDNTLTVTVKQADGSPVTDATVTAVFSMAAMPSMNMPAMRAEAPLQHQGVGRYGGTGHLSMGGTWEVAVTVARGSGPTVTRRTSIVAKE